MNVINVKLSLRNIYFHVGIKREGTTCHIKAFYRAIVFLSLFVFSVSQIYDVHTYSALDNDRGHRTMTCRLNEV